MAPISEKDELAKHTRLFATTPMLILLEIVPRAQCDAIALRSHCSLRSMKGWHCHVEWWACVGLGFSNLGFVLVE